MKRYVNLILLTTVLAINVFFRIIPASLPFTKDMARVSIMDDMAKEAREKVDIQFKGMSQQSKIKAVQDTLKLWNKERKKSIKESVINKQKELKAYWQDDSGQVFLMEIDSYHWLRLLNELVNTGKIGDKTVKNGRYDSFMLAPVGMEAENNLHNNFHLYFSCFIFRIASLIFDHIPLMRFAFFMPLLVSVFVIIALFFMCKGLINENNINFAGYFAALSLGLAPIFLYRSLGGWFDTDGYVILFSLLSIWALYLSLSCQRLYARLLLAAASGLAIGLFSFTWDGWWYIFNLLVTSALFYVGNLCLISRQMKERVNLKTPLISLAAFVFSSLLFVGMLSGFNAIGNFISEPIKMYSAKDCFLDRFWPNTFTTVSELRKTDLAKIVQNIGGGIVLFIALIYLLYIFFDKRKSRYSQNKFIGFLFIFWILTVLIISVKAERFSLLLIIPVSISFGLFIEELFDLFYKFDIPLKIRTWVKIIAAITPCVLILVIIFNNAFYIAKRISPLMNRDWWEVLQKIKKETPGGAIINSWWDYGHWFKAISERRVIFDGATQNKPISYWMAKALLTDNEAEAYGILRMLNSGSNKAFEELEKLGLDKIKCLKIINEILLLEKNDAEKALSGYISNKEDIKMILRYTHEPKIAYFIVEPSMIYKISSISFIGEWDFGKVDIYNKYKELNKEKFIDYLLKGYNYSKAEAVNTYDSLGALGQEGLCQGVSSSLFYYQESGEPLKEDGLLFFNNDFVLNLANHRLYFKDNREGKWVIPKSLLYLQGDVLKENNFTESKSDISALLLSDNEKYKLVYFDSKLAKSMFTRLYYLEGAGLRYFKPFIKKTLKDGSKIIVYRIDWQ